jgi:small subunit ribosomal protein S20
MPHTSSAKKRLRQTEKRRKRNRAVIKAIKIQIKKFSDLVGKGSADQVQSEFKLTVKRLDKAAHKRVIHPNAAARKKSQLARLLHAKAGAK